MRVREGLIPTALGTVVAVSGAVVDSIQMKKRHSKKNDVIKMAAAGVVGFGLAHVVLGAIDLVEHNKYE